ncbi:uncharacterized protein LOC116765245 [Danaus plexippus]|uniref:uncharacterized protein LOC116765245 n=1 Tax=Danaus plexippus TaxID=13037 RepID=UPI002AB1D356|nr:uncharacterized protein LOC116765245 [Danaus plexippus]
MTEQLEEELKDLREKNNELVKKVQYWKMTAAQKENEKLDLMKEMNELRLKLSRIRSGGAAHARKLDAALQTASEEVLSHLVQASSAVAHMLELNKTYMQDRQELDRALPRWSNLSNTPSSEKVNRVPPMMIGGRLIQPVVSLSRTLQSNATATPARSSNQQSHNISERAVPLHMLQDVYIPLTRIDAALPTPSPPHEQNEHDMQIEDSSDRILEETQDMSDTEEFDDTRRLEAVDEDEEPEAQAPQRSRQENPLEGPSWLLDEPTRKRRSKSRANLEPDSTTEVEDGDPAPGTNSTPKQSGRSVCEFTPTVRRRRRSPPSPAAPRSPRPSRLSNSSNGGRILKVLVAKMCLDEDDGSGDASPPKRPNVEDAPKKKSPKRRTINSSGKAALARDGSPSKNLTRFDAPSPNGSTDSRVIVLETKAQIEPANTNSTDGDNGDSRDDNVDTNQNVNDANQNDNQQSDINQNRDTGVSHRDTDVSQRDTSVGRRDTNDNQSRVSRESRDSDSSGSEMAEGRTRRARKAVVYKERPLNRKLRR